MRQLFVARAIRRGYATHGQGLRHLGRVAAVGVLAAIAVMSGGALAATNDKSASAGPEWLPLKGNFKNAIGCTWNNGCQSPTPGYHGYPAIDFMVPRYTRLYAAGPGTVEVAYRDCPERSTCGPNGTGLGNAIAIRHDNGRYSWYAHLSAVYPAEGSRVATGDFIATTGNTGSSTGPHLHYEERTTLWSPPTLPGSMFAYHGRKKVSYPEVLGQTSWQALPCGVQRGESGCKARHTVKSDGFSLEESTGGSPEGATGAAAPVDIEIAIDTSGSMQPSIDQARADARNLIIGVRSRYRGVRFAIAQLRDHTDNPEYRVEQAFTADIGLAQLAVARLSAAGGADDPEAYNLVFNRSLDPRLGWRSDSRRLLVVIGDAEPHGAGAAGFSGCRDSSADPRGFSTATELAKLKKARVTLLMVFQKSPRSTASLDCYRSLAAAAYSGGGAFGGGSNVAAAINRLIDNAIRETPPFKYVALGDSYSSGEGVDPYFRLGDDPWAKKGTRDDRCHRSSRAYAEWVQPRVYDDPLYKIASGGGKPGSFGGLNKYASDANARSNGGVTWVFWACSGAKIKNVLPRARGGEAQDDAKAGYHERMPQLDNPSVADADLITLTIGGNDVGFSDVLAQCFFSSDCATYSFKNSLELLIDQLQPRLERLYREVRASAPTARVLALGYPRLFPDSGSFRRFCPKLVAAWTPSEQEMLNNLGDRLNGAIKKAAAAVKARIEYVDVNSIFAGHEICGGNDPWINGASATLKVWKGPDDESFHPTDRGQRFGYAAAINAVLRRSGP